MNRVSPKTVADQFLLTLLNYWLSCPLVLFGQVIQGTVIPVPSSGGVGPTRSQIPFSAYYLQDVPPTRFQQVYAGSSFAGALPQGGWITRLRFVSDPVIPRQWGTILPQVEVLITVTIRNPDELSTHFADNLGSRVSTVHPLGPLSISDAATIGFAKPFFYNPAEGNLLLEIKNFQLNANPEIPQASPAPLDAYDILGDSVSRVYARGNVNATNGIADTLGLTTYFVVVPVPKLAVSLQSSNLVIGWPLGLVEFTLEQSPVVGTGAFWQSAGGIVRTNRTTNGADAIEVTLPLDWNTNARFFRLVSQLSPPGTASLMGEDSVVDPGSLGAQYFFRSVIARENLIRLVPGSSNTLAQAIQLGNVERAVIENNTIDLPTQPPIYPIDVAVSQPLHFFNNQSSSGNLIQPIAGKTADDLRARIQDALTLAL